MVSSTQCGNCGQIGHFRGSCQLPLNPSLHNWHAAKRQFRRENPGEAIKFQRRMEENRKWQEEGKTIPFALLNKAMDNMLQTLHDLGLGLDILGRPSEWEEVNKKLDALLPLIREIAHNGKGFIFCGRMKELVVDGDIYLSKIITLMESRDYLVRQVKSFVNGKLGKLAQINKRNDPEGLLRFVYTYHPPRREFVFEEKLLNGSTLKPYLKKALLHYHPDKQVAFDMNWRCLCEAISRCLTTSFKEIQ